MKIKNGRVVMYYPSIAYELMQSGLFPLNYLIGLSCHLQPSRSVWNDKDFNTQALKGSGKSLEEIKQIILEQRDVAIKEEDLVLLYDSLPPASAFDQMIGHTWKGRILRTNRSVLDVADWLIVRPLKKLGINWGKRYRTADKGDPLVLRWNDKIYSPLPAWGNVCMIDIKWRGVPTATMVYDRQPWKDYFRVLSNEDGKVVMLGVWTHKHIAGGWFTLTLDPEVVTN